MKILFTALMTLIFLPLAEAKTVTYECTGALINNALNNGHVIESKKGTLVLGDEEKYFKIKFDSKDVSCDVFERDDRLAFSVGDDTGNRYSESSLYGYQSGLLPRFSINYSYGLDANSLEMLEVVLDCKR